MNPFARWVDRFRPKKSSILLAGGIAQAGLFVMDVLNPDGRLAERVLFPNAATYQGTNHANDVVFGAASQITTWYLGFINNSGFSQVSVNDTAASHGGWSEWTGYSGSNRPTWTSSASANGSRTTSSVATATVTDASAQIKGVFLISSQAKGATSGTLWATALETSGLGYKTVSQNQVLQIYYTNTFTPVS